MFIDRKREIDLLLRVNRSKFNAIVFGERGIGKTSLLRRFQYRLRQEKATAIFVDGSSLRTVSTFSIWPVPGSRESDEESLDHARNN